MKQVKNLFHLVMALSFSNTSIAQLLATQSKNQLTNLKIKVNRKKDKTQQQKLTYFSQSNTQLASADLISILANHKRQRAERYKQHMQLPSNDKYLSRHTAQGTINTARNICLGMTGSNN